MTVSDSLKQQVEAAFTYRGNVTIAFSSGETVEAFLFNRDFAPKAQRAPAPFVEVFLVAGGAKEEYAVHDIERIELSGEDLAKPYDPGA